MIDGSVSVLKVDNPGLNRMFFRLERNRNEVYPVLWTRAVGESMIWGFGVELLESGWDK